MARDIISITYEIVEKDVGSHGHRETMLDAMRAAKTIYDRTGNLVDVFEVVKALTSTGAIYESRFGVQTYCPEAPNGIED